MWHGFTNREKGFRGARLRGLVFRVISPLPLSLPLRCCHMPVWYQHMVGNTLLSVCLFICVPVYLSSLSLCASSSLSVPCSLSPSVVKSTRSIYLPVPLPSCLAAKQLKEKGSRSMHFHCSTVHSNTYPEGHLIPFCSFPPAHERYKTWGERNILSGTSEWPRGISALRGTD